jgi:hypothetical protein
VSQQRSIRLKKLSYTSHFLLEIILPLANDVPRSAISDICKTHFAQFSDLEDSDDNPPRQPPKLEGSDNAPKCPKTDHAVDKNAFYAVQEANFHEFGTKWSLTTPWTPLYSGVKGTCISGMDNGIQYVGRGGSDFARWKGMIHLPIFMSALAEGVAAERLKHLREPITRSWRYAATVSTPCWER